MFGCVSNHFVTVHTVVQNETHMCYSPVCVAETAFEFLAILGVFWTIPLLCIQLCKTGRTCAINEPVCVAEINYEFLTTNASKPLH